MYSRIMDSRIKSLFESGCNIVIGFAVSFFSNMVILPMFGMPFKMSSFGIIGALYTVISLVRSYVIRRLFVNGFYEAMLNWRKKGMPVMKGNLYYLPDVLAWMRGNDKRTE